MHSIQSGVRSHARVLSVCLALVVVVVPLTATSVSCGGSSAGSAEVGSEESRSTEMPAVQQRPQSSNNGSSNASSNGSGVPTGDLEEEDGSQSGTANNSNNSGTPGNPGAAGNPGGANQQPEQTAQPTGPDPWANAEADAAAQLPARPAMNDSARGAYREGVTAAAAGRLDDAKTQFERALAADPRAYKAAYALGVITDRQGQDVRAIEYYRQALRVQADYERAVEGVVTIHVRRNAIPDAVAFVEPIARQWARNLEIQAIYAEVLVLAGRDEQAVTVARAALRRDERSVPAMIALVKAHLNRGRTELAETILDQAIGIDGANAEAHFLKGKMYQSINRLGDALSEFRRAAELRPDFADARTALGLQYLISGNYNEAVAELEAVSRLVPTLPMVYLNLGDAYRATKQWNAAKGAFDRSIQMNPRLAEAHFNLALMYMAAGDQFPGLDRLAALQRSLQEFNNYRDKMGPRMAREDPTPGYIEDVNRQIERETKRIEREKAKALRDAARAARSGGATAGADAGSP